MTRFASKVSQRKNFPVQLSMQNITNCNQWNTSFLLIRYNRFANAYFWMILLFKNLHSRNLNNFFYKLRKTQISLGLCAQWIAKGSVLLQADSKDSDQTGRIYRNRNRGYMEETYRQHIFMIFRPDERTLKVLPS